jgi:membrane fusion protein (multidrug efflux system)
VLDTQRKNPEALLAEAKAQKATRTPISAVPNSSATTEGRITRLTAVPGQLATPGQCMMILVPLDVWVTANLTETELAVIRPGQPVDIYIDAYGRSFPGHIDSIQAGSGPFSVCCPQKMRRGIM